MPDGRVQELAHRSAERTRSLELPGAESMSPEAADREGVDATTDIRHGVPQEQIVDYAETNPVDMVIVGTDRVAANGDVANKIGTMGVAILARHFGIPFYVASPFSTIDLATPTGADIVIEERGEEEVTHFGHRRTAPEGIKVRNPAFDVTPNEFVTAIITDRGIIEPPYNVNLKKTFG